MAANRGGRRGGQNGGRAGGRGGGRGNMNTSAKEVANLLQGSVTVVLTAFQNVQNQGNQYPSRNYDYKAFMESKPPSFKGTGGALELLGWVERIEAVFDMCECPQEKKVKFASSTFEGATLSWWNAQVQLRGVVAANAMTWTEFKALLERVYCPRSEIMKLEHEYGNLRMVGSEIEAYTARSNELATLCPHYSTPQSRRIEQYIKGLVPQIQGSVTAALYEEIEDVVRMAHQLTDQAVDQGRLCDNRQNCRVLLGNKIVVWTRVLIAAQQVRMHDDMKAKFSSHRIWT